MVRPVRPSPEVPAADYIGCSWIHPSRDERPARGVLLPPHLCWTCRPANHRFQLLVLQEPEQTPHPHQLLHDLDNCLDILLHNVRVILTIESLVVGRGVMGFASQILFWPKSQ